MTAARSDLMALAREAVAQYRGMGDKVIYSGEHAANILEHWLDRLAASRPDRSDASPGPDVRRRVLDILNAVAPAVENLVGHQEQCDMDGVMVKVSRQALDEVLNAVNEVALVSALTRPLGGSVLGSLHARARPKRPRHSPAEVRADVLRMYTDPARVPVAEIARLHEVSPAYVSKVAREEGVSRYAPRPKHKRK